MRRPMLYVIFYFGSVVESIYTDWSYFGVTEVNI